MTPAPAAPAGNFNFWPPRPPRPRDNSIYGPRARRARGKFSLLAPAPAAPAGKTAGFSTLILAQKVVFFGFLLESQKRCPEMVSLKVSLILYSFSQARISSSREALEDKAPTLEQYNNCRRL